MILHLLVPRIREYNIKINQEIKKMRKIKEIKRMKKIREVEEIIKEIR